MNGHELLPWYVSRTLDPLEEKEFETHLSSCSSCRQELEVLRSLRNTLGPSGMADLLADHPDPQEILAAASPAQADVELTSARAADVVRHVALCAACRQESDWLRGRAVARARGSRRRWAAWAAAAAAGAILGALGMTWLTWRGAAEPAAGLARLVIVTTAQRAAGTQQIVTAPEGAGQITFLFEVDLPPAGFPATLTLRANGERVIHGPRTIAADDLFRGTYVPIACPASVCGPGDYVALLQPNAAGRPGVEYRFRLSGPPPR